MKNLKFGSKGLKFLFSSILFSSLLLSSLLLSSCDSEKIEEDLNTENKDLVSGIVQESIPDVSATYIENGTQIDCENNILIFPSRELCHETIEKLDLMIEEDCDAFDATLPPDITDDEYNIKADEAGFDEDNVLRKIENDLNFCSLRKKIEFEENEWLDQQGDGDWDTNTDPDNHFIDDETERTLLSYNAEVYIGDRNKGLVYYKFSNDEGDWVEVHNNDLNAITQVSQGNIPTNNPNVVVVTEKRVDPLFPSCKEKVKEVRYEHLGQERLKRISKLRPASGTNCLKNPCKSMFGSRIKSKTKGYIQKNGRWRARRLMISAGISGQVPNVSGILNIDCNEDKGIHILKEKRRRRVKVRLTNTTAIAQTGNPFRYNFTAQDNRVYSYHKRGSLTINSDFYDMPVN